MVLGTTRWHGEIDFISLHICDPPLWCHPASRLEYTMWLEDLSKSSTVSDQSNFIADNALEILF